MELLHMHNQCGQLKARLDGSQALNSELQRALVDAHAPQVRKLLSSCNADTQHRASPTCISAYTIVA